MILRAYLVTALVMAVLGTGGIFALQALGIPLTATVLNWVFLACYPVAITAGLISFKKRARSPERKG